MRTTRCPGCDKAFDLLAGHQGRSTVVCPHCGRVVIVGAATAPTESPDDPSTEAFLEPLLPAEAEKKNRRQDKKARERGKKDR